jgi:hypothetical protein
MFQTDVVCPRPSRKQARDYRCCKYPQVKLPVLFFDPDENFLKIPTPYP